MQTMLVFAIEDTKAADHLQPFFAETQAVALRLLDAPCNDPTHNFCKYAADYHLFEIGSWDSAPCDLSGQPKKHITSLEALVRPVAVDLADPELPAQINQIRKAL